MRRPTNGASPTKERRTSPRFSFARGRKRRPTCDTRPTSSRLSTCWAKQRSTFLEKKWPQPGIVSGAGLWPTSRPLTTSGSATRASRASSRRKSTTATYAPCRSRKGSGATARWCGCSSLSTPEESLLKKPVEPFGEIDERLHREPRRALGKVLPGLLEDEGPGDVEVGPGRPLGHELAEEEPRGDRPGILSANIIDVGVGGLQHLLVLLDERKLPEELAVAAARLDHCLDQFLVVTHDPRDGSPEGANDRAGEGSGIDDMSRSLLSPPGESVGQDP